MSRPLNPKQLKFVERFLATGNATQSYIDAGYKCNREAASAASARLLGDVRVQQLLKPAQQAAEVARVETVGRIEITRDRIRTELARLAFFQPKRLFRADGTAIPVHELDDDTAAAIASLEIEEEYDAGDVGSDRPPTVTRTKRVKFWDKNRALVSLADTEPGAWAGKEGERPADGAGTGNTNVNVNVTVGTAVVPAAVVGFLRDLGLPCPPVLPADGAG